METVMEETLSKGSVAHKAGQFAEAATHYNSVLKSAPKQPDTNHNLGVLSVNTGKGLEAMPMLNIALEENPNEVQYWVSYIDALIQPEAIHDAQNMLEQAKERGVQGAPFDNLQQRIKDLTSSKMAVNNSQDPSKTDLKHLIDLFNKGQLEEVLFMARELLIKFSNSALLYNILGAANAGLGNFNVAISDYKKAITINPNYPDVHNNMADSLQKMGELDAAIASYKNAIEIKKDFAEVYNNLGNACMEKGY